MLGIRKKRLLGSAASAALAFALALSPACSDDEEEEEDSSSSVTASPSPTKYSVTSGSRTISTGDCAAYVVSSVDSTGIAQNISSATAVSTKGGGSGSFYSNSTCSVTTAAITISQSTSSNTVYFKDSAVETLTLTFTGGSLTSTTYAITVAVASPSYFTVTGPTAHRSGACNGPFTISATDAYGNASAVSGNKTADLSGYRAGAYFADSFCFASASSLTIASAGTKATAYFRDAAQETVTISADDGSGGYTAGTLSVSGVSNRMISAGGNHTCAITSGDGIKCWGKNDKGQLGYGDMITRGDGANEMATALPTVNLGTGRTAVAVTTGDAFTCALMDSYAVKCWGENTSGEVGQGIATNQGDEPGEMGDCMVTINLGTNKSARQLEAGYNHVCALLNDYTVKCWGKNAAGQLGQGSSVNLGDGAGEMGDCLSTISLGTSRSALAVTAGEKHSCALLDDLSFKCWGGNDAGVGVLGLGDAITRGDAAGEMGNTLPGINIGTNRQVYSFDSYSNHACVRTDIGTSKCWGKNTAAGVLGAGDAVVRGDDSGEMGDTLPTTSLGTNRTARAIASGDAGGCAITDSYLLKCWGNNASGILGQGDTVNRGDGTGQMGDGLAGISLGTNRLPHAVSMGKTHVCVLLDDQNVKCWGANTNGELGSGDTIVRGDGTGEMGDTLPVVSF